MKVLNKNSKQVTGSRESILDYLGVQTVGGRNILNHYGPSSVNSIFNHSISTEWLFGPNNEKKDKYFGNKIKLPYTYEGLICLYHFTRKETINKISSFYQLVYKDLLEMFQNTAKEEDLIIPKKDHDYLIECLKNKWPKEAEKVHNYHIQNLEKYGIKYTGETLNNDGGYKDDKYYLLAYCAAYNEFFYYEKQASLNHEHASRWFNQYVEPKFEVTANNNEKKKHLTMIKNNIINIITDLIKSESTYSGLEHTVRKIKDIKEKHGIEYSNQSQDGSRSNTTLHNAYVETDNIKYLYALYMQKESKNDTYVNVEKVTDVQKEYMLNMIDQLMGTISAEKLDLSTEGLGDWLGEKFASLFNPGHEWIMVDFDLPYIISNGTSGELKCKSGTNASTLNEYLKSLTSILSETVRKIKTSYFEYKDPMKVANILTKIISSWEKALQDVYRTIKKINKEPRKFRIPKGLVKESQVREFKVEMTDKLIAKLGIYADSSKENLRSPVMSVLILAFDIRDKDDPNYAPARRLSERFFDCLTATSQIIEEVLIRSVKCRQNKKLNTEELNLNIHNVTGNISHESNLIQITEKLLSKSNGMAYAGRNVSTEGISDIAKNLTGVFSAKLKSIAEVFGFNTTRMTKMSLKEIDLNTFARELVKIRPQIKDIVQSYSYSDIMVHVVPTAPGLNVDFLTAAKTISEVFRLHYGPALNMFEQLDTQISNILGNEDYRIASRPIHPCQEIAKLEQVLQKELISIISSKRVADTAKFKDLYPNMKSLLDTYEILVTISSGTTLKDLTNLKNLSNEIHEKIKVLINEIENDNIFITKPIITKLATDLENGANIVTILATFTQLYNTMVHSVKALVTNKIF